MMLFTMPALAVTYEWEDAQGTVNFTEDLGNVPKKYRMKARIVGDEEPSPAEVKEGMVKPAPKQQTQGNKEGTPVAKPADKQVYGGKDAAAWKAEFAAVNADLRAGEKQLVELRSRLNDTSGMSRTEYLSIQNTIKNLESNLLERRKKLNALKQEAEKAGVPADLMD
jgi:hypothetical protein